MEYNEGSCSVMIPPASACRRHLACIACLCLAHDGDSTPCHSLLSAACVVLVAVLLLPVSSCCCCWRRSFLISSLRESCIVSKGAGVRQVGHDKMKRSGRSGSLGGSCSEASMAVADAPVEQNQQPGWGRAGGCDALHMMNQVATWCCAYPISCFVPRLARVSSAQVVKMGCPKSTCSCLALPSLTCVLDELLLPAPQLTLAPVPPAGEALPAGRHMTASKVQGTW
jgi:hypothetical protein